MRTPGTRSGQDIFDRCLGNVDVVSRKTRGPGVNRKERDRDETVLFRSPLATPSMNDLNARNFSACDAQVFSRQYTRHIGETKACILPEEPAKGISGHVAEPDVAGTGRFGDPPLPARDGHGGDSETGT